MQRALAEKGRALLKQHAGVRATLPTFADLPAWARVGIFASAGEHPSYVRFSNGSAGHAPDRAPDVRGIALKIVGVPGKKLIRVSRRRRRRTSSAPSRTPCRSGT
jgi:hypothetical protein